VPRTLPASSSASCATLAPSARGARASCASACGRAIRVRKCGSMAPFVTHASKVRQSVFGGLFGSSLDLVILLFFMRVPAGRDIVLWRKWCARGDTMKPSMRRTVLPTDRVAAIGLDAMFAGRSSVIAGRLNRVMAFISRLMSRSLQARTVYKLSKS
jgi:hypothetical protein